MGSVASKLSNLSSGRGLVVGDVMLDRYWFGGVSRISPEAPVPVMAVDSSEERIGGAGNVACNITALGGSCTLVTVVGEDEAGKTVLALATEAGIEPCFEVDADCQTTVKLRMISRNQQLLRADFEGSPSAGALERSMAGYLELLDLHDVVVLSDYGKGALGRVEALVTGAREKGLPVFVDPKGSDFARYRGATMITPNLSEFEAVAGQSRDDADMIVRASRMIDKLGLDKLLVTLSERGMVLYTQGGDAVHRDARAREVYDVSGAGDTVIAVMALAAASGIDDEAGMTLANSAAGVVVSKLGTASASLEELRAALQRDYER